MMQLGARVLHTADDPRGLLNVGTVRGVYPDDVYCYLVEWDQPRADFDDGFKRGGNLYKQDDIVAHEES